MNIDDHKALVYSRTPHFIWKDSNSIYVLHNDHFHYYFHFSSLKIQEGVTFLSVFHLARFYIKLQHNQLLKVTLHYGEQVALFFCLLQSCPLSMMLTTFRLDNFLWNYWSPRPILQKLFFQDICSILDNWTKNVVSILISVWPVTQNKILL